MLELYGAAERAGVEPNRCNWLRATYSAIRTLGTVALNVAVEQGAEPPVGIVTGTTEEELVSRIINDFGRWAAEAGGHHGPAWEAFLTRIYTELNETPMVGRALVRTVLLGDSEWKIPDLAGVSGGEMWYGHGGEVREPFALVAAAPWVNLDNLGDPAAAAPVDVPPGGLPGIGGR